MASPIPHDLLTAREVADVMRVSTMTVYRLIKAGELPAIRVGKHLRIRERDVAKYLDERVVGTDDRPRHRRGDRLMARRLIGLDIGTNAVRVAELELSDPPRLTSFGQVALPPGAMRDGEVIDPAAVTDAIQRLWKELSLKKAPVRIGVASPRVLVRTVDLPTMSDDELAGALQFQAQDLIPIPLEDAVLDFQVLESLPVPEAIGDGPPPQPMSRVLLAAAHKDLILNLTGAVRAAGLSVAGGRPRPAGAGALGRAAGLGQRRRRRGHRQHRRRRDRRRGARARHPALRPHPRVGRPLGHRRGRARPRAHHRPGRGGQAADGHRAGRPRRAARSARWRDRSRISSSRSAARSTTTARSPTRSACSRSRSPAAARSRPVSSSSSSTPSACPSTSPRPREHIAVGDIGFPDDQLPLLDPFLPVPVGLALGGLLTGKRIDLLGTRTKRADRPLAADQVSARSRRAVLLVVLGGLYFLKKSQVDDERDKLAAAEAHEPRAAEPDQRALRRRAAPDPDRDARARRPRRLLATDVAWSSVLQALSRTIPSDVWLTSFQGTVSAGDEPAPPRRRRPHRRRPPPAPARSARRTSPPSAPSFDAVAAWIRRIGSDVPDFSDLWVPSAAGGAAGGGLRRAPSTERERDVLLDRQPDRQGQERPGRRFKVTP